MNQWMNITRHMVFCVLLAGGSVFAPFAAESQAVVSTGESFVRVTLLPGRAEAEGARMAGLVLDVAPNWKTYWRYPGAAGIPPQFDWSASRNLGSVEVLWPRPSFFESFGLTTLGYSGRVVIPVRLVPKQPDLAMEIDLTLALGVCRDICVLEEAGAKVRIEPGSPETGSAVVAAAQLTVPRTGAEQGMSGATCRISGAGKKRRFEAVLDFAHLDFTRALQDPAVILEGPEMTWFTGVETTAETGGRLRVAAGLSLLDETIWINRSEVRMTVLAGDFAADIQGCTAPTG